MIFDRFKKGFELCASKSMDDIFSDIQSRTTKQKEDKLALLYDPVNYKKLKINSHQIIVERQPGIFNPFAGMGKIFFDLESTINNGTKVRCSIDPLIGVFLGAYCLISLVPLLITIVMIFVIPKMEFSSVIFIIVMWILFLGICYLSLVFNRSALINYSKTIMEDLGLLNSNN
jgi:hypothetical protein